MLLQTLQKQKLIHPPDWLSDNTIYLTQMGSIAYGTNTDNSDVDIYGICIPKKDMVFPHLSGEILGFGRQIQRFEQWQEHHIKDVSCDKEYDFSIYGIVKYFQLLMENNPNIIDSIFTPRECVIHNTSIGELIRESRRIFLHKGCFHKFKGYAYSQMHKMGLKNPTSAKRQTTIQDYGFDTKYAVHLVRLLCEVEQILVDGDLDLRRNIEHLKSIKRGEVSEVEIKQWFVDKELQLEKLYSESSLPWGPDKDKIKKLLINCLEHHYGSLEKCLVEPNKLEKAIEDIKGIISKITIGDYKNG